MYEPGTNPLSQLAHDLINGATYDKLTTPGQRASFTASPVDLLIVPITNPPAAWAMLAGLYLWHDDLDRSHKISQKSPEELHAVARNPHGKASKSSLNTLSVESVENDKGSDIRQLEDMTPSLAFWHAIMHRREGDFSNSKYWYARCRNHPILPAIAANASAVVNPLPADKMLLRLTRDGWDPNAFVDLVEAVHQNPADPRHRVAVALQQLEWRMLFDHCTRLTAGR